MATFTHDPAYRRLIEAQRAKQQQGDDRPRMMQDAPVPEPEYRPATEGRETMAREVGRATELDNAAQSSYQVALNALADMRGWREQVAQPVLAAMPDPVAVRQMQEAEKQMQQMQQMQQQQSSSQGGYGYPQQGGSQPGGMQTGIGAHLSGVKAPSHHGYAGLTSTTKDWVLKTMSQFPGLRFTSGYRDPAHNAKVGGVPNSYHTKGRAFDMVGSRAEMDAAARWIKSQVPSVDAFVHANGSGNGGVHLHVEFEGSNHGH